jgi:choline kinase
MLDSRAPPSQIAEEEKQRDENLESEIKRLSHETRLWRVANSAQWVAWGIVQAKVPGMDKALEAAKNSSPKSEDADSLTPKGHFDSDPLSPEMSGVAEDAHDNPPGEEGDDDEDFDYLGYAQERAMFFWGDVLQLGIVKREELPESLLEKVKIVEY